MKVVCVKVNKISPKYKNLQEWMLDENNVYIGRKLVVFIDGKRFPPNDSIWANPYKIGKDGTRNEVIEKYKKYILEKINSGSITREQLMQLAGKNLGCWCKSSGNESLPCHGDVLVSIYNNFMSEILDK